MTPPQPRDTTDVLPRAPLPSGYCFPSNFEESHFSAVDRTERYPSDQLIHFGVSQVWYEGLLRAEHALSLAQNTQSLVEVALLAYCGFYLVI
jgi:hypothetical protein